MPMRIRLGGPTSAAAVPQEEITTAISFLMRDGSAHLEREGVPMDYATIQRMHPADYGGCDLVIFDAALVSVLANQARALE